MNNNNRGNNRRRGRGNNRPQGGGQQLNRIDSRARGNAPQLLEKYRKLAHDAHLNGDRVTAEYYLQFADHYFRVIADTRSRQEEQRARREDRWEDRGEEADDANEFSVESEFPSFEQPSFQRPPREERQREDRGERQRDDRPRDERQRDDRPREDRQRDDRPREDRGQRRRDERERAEPVDRFEQAPVADGNVAEDADEQRSVYEPAENPFVRESRSRGLKPRREDRRPRREAASEDEGAPTFDAAILPPSFASRDEAPAAVEEEAPAPKRRTRKPKAAPVEAADEA